ncbi:hypothetical protein J6590_000805 [Homalodisca vitripennis]|nr:hypothetical protein J6590_000805 [Homalodisca vitripennis]
MILGKGDKIAFAWTRDCRILIRKAAGVDSPATVGPVKLNDAVFGPALRVLLRLDRDVFLALDGHGQVYCE